jgi:hypothetical protein
MKILAVWLLLAMGAAAQAQKPGETPGTAKAGAGAEVRLDGSWWKQASQDARDGAISGLIDCLHWEKHEKLPNLSRPDFILKVNRYYTRHPASVTLEAALLALPKSAPAAQPGGEHFDEKHGYFDGMYWNGVPLEHRKAFVMGYLFCRTGATPGSQKVSGYVEQIDQWYKSHPKSDSTKIADVMEKTGALPGKP